MRRSPSSTRSNAARILFVGNVVYADRVHAQIPWAPRVTEHERLRETVATLQPDLIVVAGWRRLIPPDVLAVPRLGTVGFHSAKLPEYPGRAPVYWTLLRGDAFAWNTMLFLDEGIDSGDIIAERYLRHDGAPDTINEWLGRSSAEMLRSYLPALLNGTAPRTPQDVTKRGPLTTADGWRLFRESKWSGPRP